MIPLAGASEIIFNYPPSAEYSRAFDVSVEIVNFSSGVYDVKIDILNSSTRIAKILNNKEWKSTYYYVIGAINTSASNSSQFSMNITEKYNGDAAINISIRKGSSTFKSSYNLSVSFSETIIPENPTNETSENDTSQEEPEAPAEPAELNTTALCSGYNYSIIDAPAELMENFTVKVKIENCENETDFELWSYVYSASQCYSIGGREANNISVTISKGGSKIIELNNQINLSEIESGKNYSLKIKILRQGLKTPKEFTFQLAGNLPVQPENETREDNAIEESVAESSPVQPKSIAEDKSAENVRQIESKSEKINDTAVYIFAGILMALSIYLIIRKG